MRDDPLLLLWQNTGKDGMCIGRLGKRCIIELGKLCASNGCLGLVNPRCLGDIADCPWVISANDTNGYSLALQKLYSIDHAMAQTVAQDDCPQWLTRASGELLEWHGTVGKASEQENTQAIICPGVDLGLLGW